MVPAAVAAVPVSRTEVPTLRSADPVSRAGGHRPCSRSGPTRPLRLSAQMVQPVVQGVRASCARRQERL
jgi:hypothetical protein